jgi:2-dehydropantoate 2-reductase
VFLTSKVLPSIDRAALLRGAVRDPRTVIVLIQNGIGIEDAIAEAFPHNEILSTIAYIGATRIQPGIVRQKGAADLKFGRFGGGPSEAGRRLETLFAETSGVKAQFVENIAFYRWSKLLWNLPYNPVSVLGDGLDTKQMTDGGRIEALTRDLMEEVRLVAASEGIDLPEELVEQNLEFTRNFPPYKTSMLVDFEAGRPIEVEAILGNVCRIAEKNHVSVPRIQTCYALLEAIEKYR